MGRDYRFSSDESVVFETTFHIRSIFIPEMTVRDENTLWDYSPTQFCQFNTLFVNLLIIYWSIRSKVRLVSALIILERRESDRRYIEREGAGQSTANIRSHYSINEI